MKLIAVGLMFSNIFVLIAARFTYNEDNCESLTIELIANLMWTKGKELLNPSLVNSNKEVRFHLYTRQNPDYLQNLTTDDWSMLWKSNFNPSCPMRLLIHGWNGKTSTCSMAAIKDAYIKKGDYNVILVDWSDYALNVNYIHVVNEMFEISQKIADFARFINQEASVRFEDMYLIGHSAGCHIAGIAGKKLRPDRFGVIYSLDASGPIHQSLNDEWRLTPSDAIYVESIQTDIFVIGFFSADLAHASFYPNWGGRSQPHCPNKTATEPNIICDHFAALYYFVESLENSQAFSAVGCKNFKSIISRKCGCTRDVCPVEVYMGGEPAVPKKGVFYLSTRTTHPYGYGETVKIKP